LQAEAAPDQTLAQNTDAGAASGRLHRILSIVVLTGAALVPVLVVPGGLDIFRQPKELALYAVAIIAATIAAAALTLGARVAADDAQRLALPAKLAAAGVVWTIVAAAFSRHRGLSFDALVYVASIVAVTIISALALRRVAVRLVAAAVLLPAVANATLIFLQATEIWNPWVFPPKVSARQHKNALLGNPNDVGAYLVAPLLFAVTLALTARRHRRIYGAVAAVLTAGLLVTETLTAIIAAAAAIVTLAFLRRRAREVVAATSLLCVVVVVTVFFAPVGERIREVVSARQISRFDWMISGRLPAFAAAWGMFTDDPVTGIGPGAFSFEYMPYRTELNQNYSAMFASQYRAVNFGEVHNDHLQLLAESGLPGYGLVLAAIAMVARLSFRKPTGSGSERERTARFLAFPLAMGLLVTMLTGFPLQLAAPAYTFAFLAGACLAWDGAEDDVA
jgi:O-antigen ligase